MKKKKSVPPPPGSPIALRVESCPDPGSVTVRFLGQYRGILTHWIPKVGGFPCIGEQCPRERHKYAPVWAGFAPAEWWRAAPYEDWCPCVYQVTERMHETTGGLELRGTVWQVCRIIGEHGNKECQAEQIGSVSPASLRAPFDVVPVVTRLYRCLEIAWDREPVLPPRAILEASKDAPPPLQTLPMPGAKAKENPEEAAKRRAALDQMREMNRKFKARGETLPMPSGNGNGGNGKGEHK